MGGGQGESAPSPGFLGAWTWLDVLCPGGQPSVGAPPPAEGRRILPTLPTPHLGISLPFLFLGVKWGCGVWDESVLHSGLVPEGLWDDEEVGWRRWRGTVLPGGQKEPSIDAPVEACASVLEARVLPGPGGVWPRLLTSTAFPNERPCSPGLGLWAALTGESDGFFFEATLMLAPGPASPHVD